MRAEPRENRPAPLGWAMMSLRHRGRSPWIQMVLGAVVVAVALVAVNQGLMVARQQSATVAENDALRTIIVDGSGASAVDRAALTVLAEVDGIDMVYPHASASIYAGPDGDGTWQILVRTFDPTIAPVDTAPQTGQIVMPAQHEGTDFEAAVGLSLSIGYTARIGAESGESRADEVRVLATYPPADLEDIPTAFANFEDVLRWQAARVGTGPEEMLEQFGTEGLTIVTRTPEEVPDVLAVLGTLGISGARALDTGGLIAQALDAGARTLLFASVASLALVSVLLAAAAAVQHRARTREYALLRVHGWSIRSLRRLITAETLLVSVAAVLLGTAAGVSAVAVLSGGTVGVGTLTAGLVTSGVFLTSGWLGAALGRRRALRSDPYLAVRDGDAG